LASAGAANLPANKPNIIFILADDLGYGDVGCLNPAGKIATPHLDQLAASGMIFTDAHSSSAVCTPTRYGLLTGRYNWRSRLKRGVQGGMSPPLIEARRLTVAAFLKQNGYSTASIGKWHLGMDWPRKAGAEAFDDSIEKGEAGWRVDFTKPIEHGPNSSGFDYFFGIAASLDICLNDFFATCAEILREKLPDNAAEDSVSILPAMEGRAGKVLREDLVHHSINGSFAVRQGQWKLVLFPDSGGWSAPVPGSAAAQGLPDVQLYDLSRDIGETNNVQGARPEIVARLTKLLEKYVADGRSAPGPFPRHPTPVAVPPAPNREMESQTNGIQ
jgi:arylsulfatase A-like enzyme